MNDWLTGSSTWQMTIFKIYFLPYVINFRTKIDVFEFQVE